MMALSILWGHFGLYGLQRKCCGVVFYLKTSLSLSVEKCEISDLFLDHPRLGWVLYRTLVFDQIFSNFIESIINIYILVWCKKHLGSHSLSASVQPHLLPFYVLSSSVALVISDHFQSVFKIELLLFSPYHLIWHWEFPHPFLIK